MQTRELRIQTGTRLVSDVTDELVRFVHDVGADADGLLNVFVPHATAGLAVIETGSGSEADLVETIDRVWPVDQRYAHTHGSRGHGRDHLLPAFVSPSLTLPVAGGRPLLGTWQSVVLVDTNVDNRTRTVRLSFLAG